MATPDPAQFYSPIIQAMIANAQNARQRQQNEALAEQHKEELALREKEADRASKHLDFMENAEQQRIDSESNLRSATLKHQLLGDKLDIAKAIREGVLKAPVVPDAQPGALGVNQQGGPQGTTNILGVDFNPAEFSNPQEAAQQEAAAIQQKAGAQVTGARSAALPFDIAASQRQDESERQKLLLQHAQAMELGVQHGQNELAAANVHGRYQLADANINGLNHLKGIALMHSLGMDDGSGEQAGQVKQLADGIFDGNVDYSKLSQDQKKGVSTYLTGTGELGSLPTNQKDYSKTLSTVSGLQTLVNQYRTLAQNYSIDSPGAMSKGNQHIKLPLIGSVGRVEPGSDLDSQLDSVKSSGGQLASFFDQQNRKSDAEILRQVTGWFDPKATSAQNLQKINDHVNQLQQGVKTTFGNMNPDRVNKILGDKGITDFGAFTPKPSGVVSWTRDPQTGQPIPAPQGNQQ